MPRQPVGHPVHLVVEVVLEVEQIVIGQAGQSLCEPFSSLERVDGDIG